MDMNDTVQTEILTLEDLQRQKAEALEELRAQKQVMNDTARNLFAPIAPAANKGTAIMRAFNTGMAVFELILNLERTLFIRHQNGCLTKNCY